MDKGLAIIVGLLMAQHFGESFMKRAGLAPKTASIPRALMAASLGD
jgi:hypothetical protein